MSERVIEVGCMVMVVRTDECGCTGDLGRTFTVRKIKRVPSWQYSSCETCGHKARNRIDVTPDERDTANTDWFGLHTLIRR